jgi:glycosyltransferase involved in cell wall biosynthesis
MENGAAAPGLLFAMRYGNDTGYVWNSVARMYDRVAELLGPAVRPWVAYPQLTADPAFQPRYLQPVEADFYRTDPPNRARLTSVIRANRIRTVVYMGCSPRDISLRFLRRLGLKTINCAHDAIPLDARQGLVKRTAKRILRGHFHYNLFDVYVANSEAQRQFLLSFAYLPPERVHTVANGVDTELFTPGSAPEPADYGLPRTEHYALAICQARTEKRVDFLIDVAARLFAMRPDLSLTFLHVGDGPCLAEWRARAASRGLGQRFHFLGFQNQVAPLHRLASVLVHSCDLESFGLVLAEAMATGKPVVATDAPGPREIVVPGETGYLLPPQDVEGFAAAVLRLLDRNDLRARLGEAGLGRVRECFSLQKQSEQLARIVQACLSPAS